MAIKLPRRDRLTSDESVAEFLREARIAAALKHPAIVTIHDVGRLDDGRCFVVMEHIEGGSLADELAAARPAFERAARWIEDVAEAVHYAHKEGLVHRDLKPANILLDKARRPHVVDFGLAIHEEQQLRHRGERAGPPRADAFWPRLRLPRRRIDARRPRARAITEAIRKRPTGA
ncbi:MAG TPA: serine/threonine-protein kinase [Pirellulales bacterium]